MRLVVTRESSAFDATLEWLKHEVGLVHRRYLPVREDGVVFIEEEGKIPYVEIDVFLSGAPLNDKKDDVLSRKIRVPLFEGHRMLEVLRRAERETSHVA